MSELDDFLRYHHNPIVSQLRAENEQLRDKAIRFDLDQAGIVSREKEAVELVDLRAENERLQCKLQSWQTVTDYARGHGAEGSGPGDLQALIERLQCELLRIGDMAVVDWNNAVVGEVDRLVPTPPATYAEKRRAEINAYAKMKALLAYAAPSVDHTCYDPGDCKRCEINELLEAKP